MLDLLLLKITWPDSPAEWIFLGIDILLVIFVVINIVDINRFEVRRVKLGTKKLKKGEKISFVYISDLHNHRFGKNNDTLLKSIQNQNPDFIICGGDMMTAKPGKNNKNAVSFLRRLLEKNVVYYALGNHEHRAGIYPETYGKMYDEYFTAIASENLKILDNTTLAEPSSGVEIAGITIDRSYYKRFRKIKMEPAYVKETVAGVDVMASSNASVQGKDEHNGKKISDSENPYRILIAHNPDYGDTYFETEYDLFLSGHLHGGIIRLPFIGGIASPSFRLFPKYNGGLYKSPTGEKYGYVSCGLGTHTVPMRFLNPGEVTVIEIVGE